MSNLLKREKGFTLIEIVLVLAIAGLLLLIVFLAVSGAQKARRDSQRKSDLSRLEAQVESYASNTAGQYPSTLTGADWGSAGTYTPSNFTDPLTGLNSLAGTGYTTGAVPGTTAGNIAYEINAGVACDTTTPLTPRTFAVRMRLEQGIACIDNH